MFLLIIQPGTRGENGNSGKGGRGGRGGKPGIDKAWIKYSGWFVHDWEAVEGTEGAEKLDLDHHDGFWAEGYTKVKTIRKPHGNYGKQGLCGQKMSAAEVMKAKQKDAVITRSHSQQQNDDTIDNGMDMKISQEITRKRTTLIQLDDDLARKKSKLNSHLEHEKRQHNSKTLLQRQKVTNKSQIKATDDLLHQIKSDFEKLRTEIKDSFYTQQQEMVKITNPFLQQNQDEESVKDSANIVTMSPRNDLSSQDFVGQGDISVSNLFQDALRKATSQELYRAGEKYLKV